MRKPKLGRCGRKSLRNTKNNTKAIVILVMGKVWFSVQNARGRKNINVAIVAVGDILVSAAAKMEK
jgi:hypothetical protein